MVSKATLFLAVVLSFVGVIRKIHVLRPELRLLPIDYRVYC